MQRKSNYDDGKKIITTRKIMVQIEKVEKEHNTTQEHTHDTLLGFRNIKILT